MTTFSFKRFFIRWCIGCIPFAPVVAFLLKSAHGDAPLMQKFFLWSFYVVFGGLFIAIATNWYLLLPKKFQNIGMNLTPVAVAVACFSIVMNLSATCDDLGCLIVAFAIAMSFLILLPIVVFTLKDNFAQLKKK